MSIYFFFLFDSFDCPNGIGSTYIVEESVALEMLLAKVRAQHSSEQHYTEKSRRNCTANPFPAMTTGIPCVVILTGKSL